MRYSKLFGHTNKSAKQLDSVNATLLTKAGFIDQVMSGVYAYLPLGWRVLNKIENIIREEMDTLGTELLLPTLSPPALWQTTKRLETIDVLLKAVPANALGAKQHNGEYIINPTHEDVLTPIAQHFNYSYKDFPFAVYQIQTKFRNEPRAKSGLLRGREFRMKDLYSFHTSEADFKQFYEQAKVSYTKIFERLGLGQDTYLTVASGGDFTKDYSHEFQTVCPDGEDTIYIDEAAGIAYNKEVAPANKDALKEVTACEVGNIFPLGSRFSDAFDYKFIDASGNRQPVYMGSYGIGSSRVMGVLVEKFHDAHGIIWPDSVAPYDVHLTTIKVSGEAVYEQLQQQGLAVLYDDREDVSAGEKFADADLIGIPWRVVVSPKTGDKIEVKRRREADVKLMDMAAFGNLLPTA